MNDKKKKLKVLGLLWVVALSAILIRQLMFHNLDSAALLYVGVPFLIANLLLWLKPIQFGDKWYHEYINLVFSSLIVMLLTSIILFEGFICVLFFMPIYFLIIFVVFIIKLISRAIKNKNNKLYSNILPILIMISALEGTHSQFLIKDIMK